MLHPKVGETIDHSDVALVAPNVMLLPRDVDGRVDWDVRVARDVADAPRRPRVADYLVVYVPPKPAPKVGDVYEDRAELNEAALPITAVILDGAGDVARRDDVGGGPDDWTSIDEGEGCGLVGPIELLYLPGVS